MRKMAFSTAVLGLAFLVATLSGPPAGGAQEKSRAARGDDLIDALRRADT